jgi:N-acetylglucosaminyl-diphospho-decaprenol L-rhamnosyltransferase
MRQKILVSIVNYNSDISMLSKNILNLVESNSIDVSIFDNSSKKNIKNFCVENKINYFPSKNIGFGNGHNLNISLMLKKRRYNFVVILNPDVEINPADIKKMIRTLKNDKSAAIISPLLLNSDLSVQNSVRTFPNFYTFLERFLNINQINFSEAIKGHLYVPFIHGACYIMSLRDFIKLGKFNPKFFLYCEDLDLCRRVYFNNRKVILDTSIKCIHLFNRESSRSFKLFFIHLHSVFIYLNIWGWFKMDPNAKNSNKSLIYAFHSSK